MGGAEFLIETRSFHVSGDNLDFQKNAFGSSHDEK